MTREEIREGIADIVWGINNGEAGCLVKADRILRLLHSQGVVIKVDGELPVCPYQVVSADPNYDEGQIKAWKSSIVDMISAGYVAVEPLVEAE